MATASLESLLILIANPHVVSMMFISTDRLPFLLKNFDVCEDVQCISWASKSDCIRPYYRSAEIQAYPRAERSDLPTRTINQLSLFVAVHILHMHWA